MGSLGGGNHFIEICLDTEDSVWLMLHSGSRNIGKSLAEGHMARARKLFHNQELPDRDLAVFLAGTPPFEAYRRDLFWAQEYAALNRAVMLERVRQVLVEFFPDVTFEEAVSCHHNYVAEERHFDEDLLVTRKGAIRAGAGELGIIPGSMGTRSYIVRGKGNPQSWMSCAHGAGRRHSRTQAKKLFTVDDLAKQMQGKVWLTQRAAALVDEIPAAYKDIDQVMAEQADLVDVLHTLHQVLNYKGT